uniref:Uncharacterized protein n=1 Tax=Oryza glaberrima TaxID=4538 RepID=I1Q3M6_ORYGL
MRRVGQPRHARAFTPLLWCHSLTTVALCFGRRRSDRCQSSATVPNPPRYHQSASGPLLPPPSPPAGGNGSPDVEGVALADFFFGPELDDLMQWLGDGDAGQKGTLPASSSSSSYAQRGGAERAGGRRP